MAFIFDSRAALAQVLNETHNQPPATSATLRHEQAEILRIPADRFDEWEERAAIMEFEAGMSREAAEHAALADVIQLDVYRERGIEHD